MQDFYFGFSGQAIAIVVMGICYALLFWEKFNRATITMMLGAFLVIFGIISQSQAINYINFNLIALLVGMMIMVNILELSGVFQFIAIWTAKKVRVRPLAILMGVGGVSAIVSSCLDNVIAVLLIVPVIMQIAKKLEINPYPFLLMNIFATNIGGMATVIGDPPNMMIGQALGLSFIDYAKHLVPVVIVITLLLMLMFYFFWKDSLKISGKNRVIVMNMKAKDSINDFGLLYKTLIIFFFVVMGFLLSMQIGINKGVIALCGAAVMLCVYTVKYSHNVSDEKVESVLNSIDWITIFFFIGLFVIVGALDATGVLQSLGHKLVEFTDASVEKSTYVVLVLSAIFSAMVDNIAFVATMLPMIEELQSSFGGREAMMPVWWALSLGACLGGNGTLIGASANVIVAGIASREGQPLNFARFLIWSIPVMIMSILVAAIFLYLEYFL